MSYDKVNSTSQVTNSQAIRSSTHTISQLLNTNLSPETLDICTQLCESGVHPQVLADIIHQIRRSTNQENQYPENH